MNKYRWQWLLLSIYSCECKQTKNQANTSYPSIICCSESLCGEGQYSLHWIRGCYVYIQTHKHHVWYFLLISHTKSFCTVIFKNARSATWATVSHLWARLLIWSGVQTPAPTACMSKCTVVNSVKTGVKFKIFAAVAMIRYFKMIDASDMAAQQQDVENMKHRCWQQGYQHRVQAG